MMGRDHLKVMVVNDPHISDYPPESRRDKFPDTPLGKVEQAVQIALKYKPDVVIFTGDHFHFKYAERTKYSTTRRYAELIKQMPGHRRTLIGNHDVPYDKPDRWVKQPISVLIDSGALSFFGGDYEVNEEVFTKGDLKVRFKGIHYYKGQNEEDLLFIERGDEDWLVSVTHMDLFPLDTLSYDGAGVVHYESVKDGPSDVVINGHIHDDLGIVRMGSTTFVNVGNLLRGSISESDLSRTPKIAFLIFMKDELKTFEIPLEVAPPHEVFQVVKNLTRKNRKKEMESFVKIFGSTSEEGSEEFDYGKVLDAMDLEPEIRIKVDNYIEDAKALARG